MLINVCEGACRAARRGRRPGRGAGPAAGPRGGRAAVPRGVSRAPVADWVERFDRRGTEPFELFTSEFDQNSVKIQYILLEN